MNEHPPQDNQPPPEPQRPLNEWPQQPYPQQQYPQQPLPPQQDFPSQPGVPPNPRYPNYQPQSGQYPYQQPPMQQPMTPVPPEQPSPKKKHGPVFWVLLVLGILLVVGMCSGIMNAASHPSTNTTANEQATPTEAPTATPVPTDTPRPTDTPVPTQSPAQVEKAYKALTTSTTVTNLDKDGNGDKGKDVRFTCKISNFVKDDSGNTAGANVDAPDYSSGVVQISFPDGTDLSKLNEGDILTVWGNDGGVFSGQNAFGGTVQEVGIGTLYLTDQTTNYQTH